MFMLKKSLWSAILKLKSFFVKAPLDFPKKELPYRDLFMFQHKYLPMMVLFWDCGKDVIFHFSLCCKSFDESFVNAGIIGKPTPKAIREIHVPLGTDVFHIRFPIEVNVNNIGLCSEAYILWNKKDEWFQYYTIELAFDKKYDSFVYILFWYNVNPLKDGAEIKKKSLGIISLINTGHDQKKVL